MALPVKHDKILQRRLSRSDYLRPVDLARMVGIGVTQVRTYEEVGFLPPAARGANGHRRYGLKHAEALRVSRTLIAGYGWQHALEVMRAVHGNDDSRAFALADSKHAELARKRRHIKAILDAYTDLRRGPPVETRQDRRPRMRVGEAAKSVGVNASAVRFWESKGLVDPVREHTTGYRLYDSQQMERLNVIALLRKVGHRFGSIRRVLDELAAGRPEQVLVALRTRLENLDRASMRCSEATSALFVYVGGGKGAKSAPGCAESPEES